MNCAVFAVAQMALRCLVIAHRVLQAKTAVLSDRSLRSQLSHHSEAVFLACCLYASLLLIMGRLIDWRFTHPFYVSCKRQADS